MTTPVLVYTDTAPLIEAVITNDAASAPLDLTDATSVFIQVRLADDRRMKINGVCTIVDATAGSVSYQLATGDLDFEGACKVRFLVVWNDSRRQHTTPQIDLTVEPE
jgi:hypothetical protein